MPFFLKYILISSLFATVRCSVSPWDTHPIQSSPLKACIFSQQSWFEDPRGEQRSGREKTGLFVLHHDPTFHPTSLLHCRSPLTLQTQLLWRKRDLSRASCHGTDQHIVALVHWYRSTHCLLLTLTIDVISGMPTAPSLTGLKCKRQREITKRWKNHYISTLCSVVITTLWSHYSRS